MTIPPKKKISQHKSRVRHSARQTLNLRRLVGLTNTTSCKNCGAIKLSHRICKACGYYGNKQVMTIKSKSKETIVSA